MENISVNWQRELANQQIIPLTAKSVMVRRADAIYDLIEQHLPNIEIQDARDGFRYIRPQHDGSILVKETRL